MEHGQILIYRAVYRRTTIRRKTIDSLKIGHLAIRLGRLYRGYAVADAGLGQDIVTREGV